MIEQVGDIGSGELSRKWVRLSVSISSIIVELHGRHVSGSWCVPRYWTMLELTL